MADQNVSLPSLGQTGQSSSQTGETALPNLAQGAQQPAGPQPGQVAVGQNVTVDVSGGMCTPTGDTGPSVSVNGGQVKYQAAPTGSGGTGGGFKMDPDSCARAIDLTKKIILKWQDARYNNSTSQQTLKPTCRTPAANLDYDKHKASLQGEALIIDQHLVVENDHLVKYQDTLKSYQQNELDASHKLT